MKPTHFNRAVLAVAVAGTLAACGGGSSSGSSTSTVSRGVVTAHGSIVVNGIHFNEGGSRVSINDQPGLAPGTDIHRGIKVGMTVKIRGSVDAATGTGVASSIEVEHEVEGAIASISGNTFVVHGQTVTVDAQTLYDGIPGGVFGGLAVGMQVEVYGLRDANGIRATLIELEDTDFEDEVRGVVSNLNTTDGTFNIGTLLVHYVSTTPVEDGTLATDLVNGAIVEVHLDATNHATKIEFEDNEDSEFEAADGDDMEVEGYVSNYDSVAGTFMIGDVRVRVTGMTVYEGTGTLANNVKVEAEGAMVNGELVASEVEYEDD